MTEPDEMRPAEAKTDEQKTDEQEVAERTDRPEDDDGDTPEATPEITTDATEDPSERRSLLRRKIAAIALLVGLCLGVLVTRAVWEGRTALDDGDAALKRGDEREAITRWRRAARWYLPLAPHVEEAYQRLERIAREAEQRGDIDTALMAWRGVRSSILATRSFYTPHSERLEPANRRIAALMARQEAESGQIPGVPAPAQDNPPVGSEAWHYELLARDHSPSAFWSIVALLGFAMWIGGGLLFALRGVTAEDRLVPRMAAYAGILIAVGLLVWMTGLYAA